MERTTPEAQTSAEPTRELCSPQPADQSAVGTQVEHLLAVQSPEQSHEVESQPAPVPPSSRRLLVVALSFLFALPRAIANLSSRLLQIIQSFFKPAKVAAHRDIFKHGFGTRVEQLEGRSLMATLAGWDFTGESSPATSTADIIGANLDVAGNLTRGTGAAASSATNSFRTTGFQNNGISTANTDFFETTLSASPGYALSLTSLDARFAGTSSFRASPGVSAQFAYSLDGGSFTLIGSPFSLTADTAMPQISLSGISALQNIPASTTVSFRYYASGQTTTGGWGFNSPSAATLGNPSTYGFHVDGVTISTTSPNIFGGAASTNFTSYAGAASAVQTFPISGSLLTDSITATAPTGFEVSNNGTTWGSTATFAQSGGNASGTLSVRLAANAAVGAYNSQNIVLTSPGATSVNITTPSAGNYVSAQQLVAGDISLVAFNASTTDSFSFTNLKPLSAGTVIVFTDNGFASPSTGFAGEGFLIFTAQANYPAGTVFNWTNGTSVASDWSTGSGGLANAPTNFSLNAGGGDQIFAFQGPISGWASQNGVLVINGLQYGAAFITNGSAANATSYEPAPSIVPSANLLLHASANALNGYYSGSTAAATSVNITGSPATIVANLDDAAKWFTFNSLVTFPSTTVSVSTISSSSTTATAFSSTYGTASTAQVFTVSGSGLTADLVATAPAGFEVSSDGSTFGSTATFTQTSGSANGTLSVRLAANASVSGSYNSQNIVLSSTGATSVNITTPASGNAVLAKELTLGTATVANKVYDGTTSAGTASVALVGIVGSDVVTASGSAAFADKNVGTAKSVSVTGITLAGAAAGNYSLASNSTTASADITAKALVASATGTNKTYNGNTTASVSISLAGIVGSEDVTVSAATASFADKNVGTAKSISVSGITLAGADAGNYSVNATATASADITALAITGSVTANNKTFDGTTSATIATRTLTGAISGDDVSYTGGTAVFASSAIGTGITVNVTGLSLSGADAGNYTVNTSASTTADITAPTGSAQTITFNNPGPKTYGDASFDLGATSDSGLTVTYEVVTGPATISGSTLTITGAGSVTVRASQAGDSTYNPATPVEHTFSVAQKSLSVSITGSTKTYDGTLAATVTYSLTGIIGSDTVTASGTAVYASKNVGTGIAVNATGITLSGASAANYELGSNSASTTADISAKALTASITAANKVYDATTAASVTYSLSGVVGSEDVTASGSATFADKNVGTAKTVTATGITLSGADAGNYTVNADATATANITAASLTVTVSGSSKVYDATTSASVSYTVTGIVGSDAVTASGTATFDSKNVGTGKTINVTAITLSGADAGNYTSNASATATADVTALAITGSITASNKNYDGTTSATIATRTLAGVLGTDVVTYSGGTATFSDALIANGKTVSATGLSLSGADAGNYTVNTSATATANILAAPVASVLAQWNFDSNPADGSLTTGSSVASVGSGTVAAIGGTVPSFATGNGGGTDNTGMGITTFPAQGSNSGTAGIRFSVPTNVGAAATATGLTISFDFRQSGTASRFWQLQLSSDGTNFVNASGGTASFGAVGNNTGTTFGDDGLYSNTASSGSQQFVTGLTYSLTGGAAASYVNNANFAWRFVSVFAPSTSTYISANAGTSAAYTTGSTGRIDNVSLSVTNNVASSISVSATGKTYDGTAVTGSATVTGGAAGGTGSTGAVTYTYYNGFGGNNGTNAVLSGAPINAGNYSVVASVAADSTYAAATSAPADFTISQAVLTATVSGSNKVYDRLTDASVSYSLAGIVGTDDVSASGTAAFADKNVGTGKTISVSGITLTGAAAANYTVNGTATTAADISALAITGSVTINNKTFDGTNSATIATRTLSGVISGDLVSYIGGTATFDDVAGAIGTAKPVTVTGLSLDGADAGNYTVNSTATATANITASVQSQTITFDAISDKVYGDAGFELSATATSSLPVTFSVISGPATISGSTLSITGVGAVVVEATQAGDASYAAATPVQRSFNVASKTLTATITGSDKVYDTNTSASVSISLNGLVGSDVVTVSGSASFADKNVGTGKTISVSGITLAGVDASKYTIASTGSATADITAVNLSAVGTASSKIYDGSTSASVSIALTGVLSGDAVTGTASGTFADKNAGAGKTVTIGAITLAGTDAANYTVGSAADATADITAKSLTASGTAADKVYNATNEAAVTISLIGVVSGDVVSGTATGTFADKNVGLDKEVTIGTVTLVGDDAMNYTVGSAGTTTADISAKALTAVGSAANKIYDTTTAAVVSISLTGIVGMDDVMGSASGSFADKNAGLGKVVTIGAVTLSGTDAANYTVGSAADTTADIAAASLTATAAADDKVYDATTAASVSITLTGVLGTDEVTGSASGSFANKNVGSAKIVTVGAITLTGADAANYTVGSAGTTTANVTAADLTASASAADKVYNATTAASVTITLTGVLGSDAVTASASGSFADKNVGSGKMVTVGSVTLAGDDAANYTVGTAADTTASITVANLTASATVANKVYDATTAASVTINLVGVVSGDEVTGSASGSFADKSVGTGKAVTVGAVILSGADAANYEVGSAGNATADISAKALTAIATAADKEFDGTTTATVTIALTGVVAGDTVTGSASGEFLTAAIGTGKTVTVGTVTLAGDDASNYTVGAAPNTTANITAPAGAPVVNPQTFPISSKAANRATVGTVIASDTPGQTLSYAISGGNGAFAINAATGVITVADAKLLPKIPRGQTSVDATLTVTVTDNGTSPLSTTATMTVRLQAAATAMAPTLIDSSVSMAENNKLTNGTAKVGTVKPIAAYSGQKFSNYAITGPDASFFNISSTGLITLATGVSLDFESKPSYSIVVSVADSTDATKVGSMNVTIGVRNLNEAPVYTLVDANNAPITITKGTALVTIDENIPGNATKNGLVIARLSAADQDQLASTLSYQRDSKGTVIIPDKTLAFGYNPVSGEITIIDENKVSFERNKSIKLSFIVTDNAIAGVTTSKPISTKLTVTVNINDLNEAPVFTSSSTFNISENNKANATVGTVKAVDADSKAAVKQTVTYSLVSAVNDGGSAVSIFSLNSNTGKLTIPTAGALNFEASKHYDIVVRATDNGNPSLSTLQTIRVNVLDVNEASSFVLQNALDVPATSLTVSKASNNGTKVGRLLISDVDAGGAGTYTAGSITTAVQLASKGALTYNELTGDLTILDKTKLTKKFDLSLSLKDSATTKSVTSKFKFTVDVTV